MRTPGHTIRTDLLNGCPLCAGSAFFTEIEGRDFQSGTGRYRVERCRQCGLRFTNPRPGVDSLNELYYDRDSADYVPSHGVTDRLRALAIRRWIGKVKVHSGPCGAVLDYGCGDGFFSLQLSRCSDFGHITAVDLHDRAPYYLADQKRVRYHSFERLPGEDGHYQLIFCRHVLEHVPDPLATAADLNARLALGGTLVVEVPNYHSLWRKLFGPYYFGLYLPRHLLHFDECSLREVFRGYRQVKLYRNHTPVLGQSLGNLTGLALGNLGPVGLGLFPLQILADEIARSCSVLSLVLRKQKR